jgi:hypothetical protein
MITGDFFPVFFERTDFIVAPPKLISSLRQSEIGAHVFAGNTPTKHSARITGIVEIPVVGIHVKKRIR